VVELLLKDDEDAAQDRRSLNDCYTLDQNTASACSDVFGSLDWIAASL
jgi:hypothetical protein